MSRLPISNERIHLRSPSINVCFRITIEESLKNGTVEKAVKKILKRHPYLGSSVTFDNDHNAWLVPSENEIEVECYSSNEIDWATWYTERDNTPFDLLHGPLVRICAISGATSEIIILGHHILGDGIGYLNLVKDLLLAIDNRIDPSPQFPPSEESDLYFKETVLPDQQTASFAQYLNDKWRKSRICISESEYRSLFEAYRKEHAPDFLRDCSISRKTDIFFGFDALC